MNQHVEFLYKLNKLKNDDNSALIEAAAVAYGKLHNCPSTLTENEQSTMECIEQLENARNGQDLKVFFESITKNALESVTPENKADIVEGLTSYKNWIMEHQDAIIESDSGNAKRKWIRKIYDATQQVRDGIKRDDNWAAVKDVFDAIKTNVPEVKFDVSVPDGGYSAVATDGMPRRKTYQINATTPEGYPIAGQLHCDAAGTVEDPFSAYDITLVLN